MATVSGVGTSFHRNPKLAVKEAMRSALREISFAPPDLVLLFAAIGYPLPILLATIREMTGSAPLIGCSGGGIVAQAVAYEGYFYLGVMVIQSNDLEFSVHYASGLEENSYCSGEQLALSLKQKLRDNSLGLILFADGLTCNFDQLTQGLRKHIPESSLPLFGGLAGDNLRWKKTVQFFNDTILHDSVVAVLLSGKGRLAWATHHGCTPIGNARMVTRAEKNRIYEIDGIPILEVLKEYLHPAEVDQWGTSIVNLGLGFEAGKLPGYDDPYLIRFIPVKDQLLGAVKVPIEITSGTSVWVTRRDKPKMIHGIEIISNNIISQLNGSPPKFLLHFDCVGRGKTLFREEEKKAILARLQSRFHANTPWLGFYTYGGIAPVGRKDCFHHYALALLALY